MSIPQSHGYMFVIDFVPGGFDIDMVTPSTAPDDFGTFVGSVSVAWDDVDPSGIHEGAFTIEHLPKQLESHAAGLLARHLVHTYIPEQLNTIGEQK